MLTPLIFADPSGKKISDPNSYRKRSTGNKIIQGI
jgi:hypothetical protein